MPPRTAGPSSALPNCSARPRSPWPRATGYETPWLFAAYSDAGLDGISEAFYAWFRGRPHHPGARSGKAPPRGAQRLGGGLLRPPACRPCSSWPNPPRASASNATCSTTAGSAAAATTPPASATGTSTRTSGPTACTPLIDAVTAHGMEFGLWVEPEMVNEDSDLARAHPDWIAGPGPRPQAAPRPPGCRSGGGTSRSWTWSTPRRGSTSSTGSMPCCRENRIGYLKWDQNRDLTEMGHAGRPVRARPDPGRLPAPG